MTLALIPLLLAEQSAGTAWHLGGSELKQLVQAPPSKRLLMILYNDYEDQLELAKKEFYGLLEDADLRSELEVVVAGRRRVCDADIARLADLFARHINTATDNGTLAEQLATDAIAIASFAIKNPRDLLRYLVARVEDIDLMVAGLEEIGVELLEGQALLQAQADSNTTRILDVLANIAPAEREVIRYVRSDWGPEGARKALAQLGERDPAVLAALQHQIGEPPTAEALDQLVKDSPAWLTAGPAELRIAIARLAEQLSDWGLASDQWEVGSVLAETTGMRADLLVRAAIAAGVLRDAERYQHLIEKARTVAPDAPRLVLELASDIHDPDQQLERLSTITSGDVELTALVAAQQALANLLKGDMAQARARLDAALSLAPSLPALRSVDVNVTVQEARLAVSRDRAIDSSALSRAAAAAVEQRDAFIATGRYEESGRLLMLLCDAKMLLGEVEVARELIAAPLPEELASGSNAEVLAEVALRLSRYRLAETFLAGYPDTPGAVRQRAAARVHTGSSTAVKAALGELHDIALAESPEADLAGLNRLLSCVEKPQLEWDEEVAERMIAAGHARVAIGARARQLARTKRYEDAVELLTPHDHELWALEGILHVAIVQGNPESELQAAEAVLAAGPDQPMTVMCGTALRLGGHVLKAIPVLIGVAHNPGAATAVRADAYHSLLLAVANDQGDWERVRQLHAEWTALIPDDHRLSAWQARILVHQ